MRPWILALSLAVAPGVANRTAWAEGFTERAAFDAAVAGLAGVEAVESFDNLPADTILANGLATASVTFRYDLDGVNIQVREVSPIPAEFSTTSLPHYLGTEDGGVFQGGDSFDIYPGPGVRAVGLSITSIDELEAGDIQLSTTETNIVLDPTAVQSTLGDGASEYFLGIVDNTPFIEVSLTTAAGGFFLYTIDDLTVIRPESIFSDRFEP
jgi:hypothetical protein